MTASSTAVTDARMIVHAQARGAVDTPYGRAALVGWGPPAQSRCHIRIAGRNLRPLKRDVTPITCGICWQPANPVSAAAGLRLCTQCTRDQQEIGR